MCQVRLIVFNTNLIIESHISYVKNVLNLLYITANFVKFRYKRKRHFGWPSSYFFAVQLFVEFL